jgi:CHAT domain
VLFGVPYRCRRCHGLQYSSQYQSAGSRTIGRLQAIRTRLGGSGDLFEPFPARAEAHAAQDVHAAQGDADWVILSACNTAAGGTEGAEALSGMSRAFFYAGARALLVSHWAVNSDAAVKLITKTLSTMAADKAVSRSEALRRSMVALIEQGEPQEAHPAYWAPFVLVGEGGTGEATRSVTRAPAVPVLVPPRSKKRRLLPSPATRGMSPGQQKFGGSRQTSRTANDNPAASELSARARNCALDGMTGA